MEQWIENVVFENRYYSDSEIRCLFEKEVKDRFSFCWDGCNVVYSLSILPQYINILNKHNLSENDLKNNKEMYSLCFFDGHEDEIKEWIESCNFSSKLDITNNTDDTHVVPIIIESAPIQLVKKDTTTSNTSNYIGHTKKIVSDKVKSIIGKKNEKLVYDSMIQNPYFKEVIGISKNLDSINGNDNAHYDITYKDVSDLEKLRYLEVKTANRTSGGYSFLMSSYEYEFAKKHIDYYDIALVFEHEIIKICKSFFKHNIEPSTHTYEVIISEE